MRKPRLCCKELKYFPPALIIHWMKRPWLTWCLSVFLPGVSYVCSCKKKSIFLLHWLFIGWKSSGWPDVCLSRTTLSLSKLWQSSTQLYISHIISYVTNCIKPVYTFVYLFVGSQPVFKFRNKYIQLSIYDGLQDLLKTHISVAGDSNSNYVYTSINVSYTSILGAPYSNSY